MSRPYWMEHSRISDGGVPEILGAGRWRATRTDRLRHVKKANARRKRQEWIQQYLKQHELSIWQKRAGARRIA